MRKISAAVLTRNLMRLLPDPIPQPDAAVWKRNLMTFETYPRLLLALCIWREARNQNTAARLGVKHVILNRVAKPAGPYHECKDIVHTILCPAQFTSFHDRNAALLPDPKAITDFIGFQEICDAVDTVTTDPTHESDSYHDTTQAPPAWALANPRKFTVQLGNLRFYKLY